MQSCSFNFRSTRNRLHFTESGAEEGYRNLVAVNSRRYVTEVKHDPP